MSVSRIRLRRYAWLSMAAACGTISLKLLAWYLTGSVSLFSDAMESLVNLAAAGSALLALTIAALPPDEEHEFGHDKVEFFAAGFEGALIMVASFGILWVAGPRLFAPQPIEVPLLGVAFTSLATMINLWVARLLMRVGVEHYSPSLEADGRHLLSDVWTSAGVIVGIALVSLTGWQILDPLMAVAVAAWLLRSAFLLLKKSVHGLLDRALEPCQRASVQGVLDHYSSEGMRFHALRTRVSGSRHFVSVHVLVPDDWTVRRGHDLLERIEADLRAVLPNGIIFTHLEPLDDPKSWHDENLDRDEGKRV